MTSAATRVLGVIGWPVSHSRSPAMHTAALAAMGEDAVYVPFAVPPGELPRAIAGLRSLGVLGVNLTLPHKQSAMALVDVLEPSARAVGAVNTIVREGERLIGANTDAAGLVLALRAEGVEPRGLRALVLGAGGAARAALHGLGEAGAAVRVAARRAEQAEALARSTRCDAVAMSALGEALRECDLLVQATSATLGGGAAAETFASTIPLSELPGSAVVIDLVYSPLETTVLRDARRRGLRALDGLGMLAGQGALALERWLGRPAPLDVMRAALSEPEAR